jgi:methylphosphotriester-DNA--protein-cysteine methyltransferase
VLDKNYREKKMVAEYAAELSVTPNYLNRVVKGTTGISAGHHIRQRGVLAIHPCIATNKWVFFQIGI